MVKSATRTPAKGLSPAPTGRGEVSPSNRKRQGTVGAETPAPETPAPGTPAKISNDPRPAQCAMPGKSFGRTHGVIGIRNRSPASTQ